MGDCIFFSHYQHGSLLLSGTGNNIKKDPRRQVTSSRVNDSLDPTNHPSKLVRINDGRAMPSSSTDENKATSASGPSQIFTSGKQIPQIEEASVAEKQATQVYLM